MKTYFDLKTDGGSGVIEQVAEQKQRVERSLAPIRHLVAVGSGKGGVGKSTLTMLLALGLRSRGWKPAVLDADLNGPTQSRLGGLSAAVPLPAQKGLAVAVTRGGVGVVSLGTLFPEPNPIDFPSVAQGDSFVWRATREFSLLGELLAGCDWGAFDFLLLDLPPGSERTVHFAEFLGPRARFVLVTLPSALSHGVVSRSVSALRKNRGRLLGYIENMKGYLCEACGSVRPLFPDPPEPGVDAPCLGSLPFDPRLADLCERGLFTLNPRPADLGQRGLFPAGSPLDDCPAVLAICDNLVRVLESET